MQEHGTGLFEEVEARFADLDNAHVIQGEVPAILAERGRNGYLICISI